MDPKEISKMSPVEMEEKIKSLEKELEELLEDHKELKVKYDSLSNWHNDATMSRNRAEKRYAEELNRNRELMEIIKNLSEGFANINNNNN